MAGRLITELTTTSSLQDQDFIPVARGSTTLKFPANDILTRSNSSFGDTIQSGLGVATQDCRLELGILRTAAGNSYIDLHSNPNTDYSARLIRLAGTNGGLTLSNTGIGNLDIRQIGAGNINLATSNTTRMAINSVGFVGIGQTSPTTGLHITGNEGSSSDIILESLQSSSYTGSDGSMFIFQHKGNLGYTKLNDVISSITSQGYSTAAGQVGYQPAGQIQTVAVGNFNAAATRSADMTFGTSHNGTFVEKLRIKSDGKIGIGTSTPAATLEIQPGSLTLGRTNTSTEGGEIKFCRAGDNAAVWSIDQFGTGTSNSGSLRIFNTQTESIRMVIDSSGNVGIGTSSPTYTLDVAGTSQLLRLVGSGIEKQGMTIKTADASASVARTAFWEHQNENNFVVSSINSRIFADGGTELTFSNTLPGVRTESRISERLKFDRVGNAKISANSLGIGREADSKYRLTIDGTTYSTAFRASQGIPNLADLSTRGYSFGDDGDTGLFSSGTGAAGGTVSLYANNQEIIKADTSNVTINKNLVVSSVNGFSITETFTDNDSNMGRYLASTKIAKNLTNQSFSIVEYKGVITQTSGGTVYLMTLPQTGLKEVIMAIATQITPGTSPVTYTLNYINSRVTSISWTRSAAAAFSYHIVGYL